MEKGSIISHDIEKAPKTGEWKFMRPEVDKEKCLGCSTCVPFCPEACIEVVEHKARIDMDWCKGCGVCVQVCPIKAIIMKKD